MSEREEMIKEVVTKEDGRTLIYYRFRPKTGAGGQTQTEGESQA